MKDKNKPLVDVIVPTYNRVDKLRECLDSLLEQDYPPSNYSIIVVDDGSSDGTKELLDQYSRANENMTYFTQKNKGSYSARNLGISNSQGEIVCLLDDDCVAEKDWIMSHVKGYTSPDIGGVGGKIIGYSPRTQIEKYVEKNKLFDQENMMKIFLVTANASYRRKVFEQIGGFDDNFRSGGDADMGIRTLHAGFKLVYGPDAVVNHKHRSTLRQLLRQHYIYGKGYCLLHKKYPHYFSPYKRIFRFGRRIFFKTLTLPLKTLRMLATTEWRLSFIEPVVDVLLLSSEILGISRELISGRVYPGEKIYDDMPFIPEAKVSGGWGR